MDKEAIEQLRIDEGESLTIYNCTAGVPTIGVGRNLEAGITKEESNYLFMNDIARVNKELADTFVWHYMLSPTRRSVMVNMCFNLGLTRFMTFKKMLAALECRDYEEAAKQMLDSKWANQVGERSVRLAKQMLEG